MKILLRKVSVYLVVYLTGNKLRAGIENGKTEREEIFILNPD